MMTIVAGVTLIILFVTNRGLQASFDRLFQDRYESESVLVEQRQAERLKGVRQACDLMVSSPRFQQLMRFYNREKANNDQDRMNFFSERIYLTGENDLAYVFESEEITSSESMAQFFFVIDAQGDLVLNANMRLDIDQARAVGKVVGENVKRKLVAGSADEIPDVGYWVESEDGAQPVLLELVTTLVIDVIEQEVLGMFVVGFVAPESNRHELGESKHASSASGIWVENRHFSPALDEADLHRIHEAIETYLQTHDNEFSGSFLESSGPVPGKVFFTRLDTVGMEPVFRISYFSLAEVIRSQQSSRNRIVLTGAVGLFMALIVGLALSHGLSEPVRSLVAATRKIEAGDFDFRVDIRNRDEMGMLGSSFNRMTEGLALKERYRSLLDKVTDRDVAAQLIQGKVELGGESVDVAILFCDIRGFTAITGGMEPDEVIRMLNEHFTPLTRVVAEHKGVVDKFVGDLIMAVFGAPKQYGEDSLNAVKCAEAMIRERTKLNNLSKYNIEMGIGVASGPVVAGNMGSENRLNYTVLGERVNLASRLCSQAARMEIIVDETTQSRIGKNVETEALPPVTLKGYRDKVPVYRIMMRQE